jgi:hypothetical protein
MKKGICKLCDKHKELCKSHIVPEFCYQILYNKKHKFVQLSSKPDERTLLRPKGLYDRLLCRECESRVKVFEDYFKEFITDENLKVDLKDGFVEIDGIDSAKLKLFIISIIWRYYVSKFKMPDFDLGPYSKTMKEMIWNSVPGPWHRFGFLWIQGVSLPESFSKSILLPVNKKIESHRVVFMVLLGVFWVIFTSKHAREHWMANYFCRDSNLNIILDDSFSKQWFSEVAHDLNKQKKLELNFNI